MSIFTTIRRWSLYLLLVFLGWIGVLSLVMVLSDAAPGAIAYFPSSDAAPNLPEGAGVISGGAVWGGGYWIGVRSDSPGLGGDLYRAGAVMVLPSGLAGCLPM